MMQHPSYRRGHGQRHPSAAGSCAILQPSPWHAAGTLMVLTCGLLSTPALAQESESHAWAPRPMAGHAVFDLRVGVDQLGPSHPFICGEISPLPWLSVEGCGTGSGFLHQGDEPDMAHFRSRFKAAQWSQGRTELNLLLGGGFAEVQSTADQPGFKFGTPKESDPIEAAGPEASVGVKGRAWLDPQGKTYVTADWTSGAAYIPGAEAVLGAGPVVPFTSLTMGLGF